MGDEGGNKNYGKQNMNSSENLASLCRNEDFSSISVAVHHWSQNNWRVPSC